MVEGLVVIQAGRRGEVLSCNDINVMDFIGASRPCMQSHFGKKLQELLLAVIIVCSCRHYL